MPPSSARKQSGERTTGRSFTARGVGRTAVLIWHTEVSLEGARAIAAVFADLRVKHLSEGLGFLTVLERDTDIRPSPAARQAVAQVLTDFGSDIGAAAIAYEADGFKATIVRSVITAINLASSTRFPNRVFAGTDDAIDWIAETLRDEKLSLQLRSGLAGLRKSQPGVSGQRLRTP